MTVEARVRVERDGFSLDVEVAVADGETVALLGPNGAGKSTLLGAIAGLVSLDAGRVVLGDVVVDDPTAGVHVPAEHRHVGYVFQAHLLFPHLSALENVAYGLRCHGVGRSEARRRAGEWLERLGLADRAAAKPAALSGGEAQRVALARALAPEPQALLLDEPLSALDVETRDQVRRDLRTHLATFAGPRLLVTHDPVEAMVLADRIVVLEGGRVTHTGTMADLARHPRSPYVARLVGVNLYRGRLGGGVVALVGGGTLVGTPDEGLPPTADVVATVRPQSVALHRSRPEGTPRNVWAGVVSGIDQVGDRVRISVDGAPEVVAEITTSALADLRLTPGDPVWVSIKAADVTLSPT